MIKFSFTFIFAVVIFCCLSMTANAGILVTGAFEQRFEQGLDQNTDAFSKMNFSGEYHWKKYLAGFEVFQGALQNTGQSALILSSQQQGAWLTGAYQAGAWKFLTPYFRMGIGGYEDSVTTTLLGVSTNAVSRLYAAGFGGIGARLNTVSPFFASVELRLVFAENQTPQPAFAALVRIGWEFGAGSEAPLKEKPVDLEINRSEN